MTRKVQATTRPNLRRGHQQQQQADEEQTPLLVQEVILGCHLLLGGNYIYGAKRWEPYAQELDRVSSSNHSTLKSRKKVQFCEVAGKNNTREINFTDFFFNNFDIILHYFSIFRALWLSQLTTHRDKTQWESSLKIKITFWKMRITTTELVGNRDEVTASQIEIAILLMMIT